MKIVIDMQGCQTSSRFRGIGRYTIAFVHGIIKNNKEHDIYLLCNAKLTESLEEIQNQFSTLVPKGNILYFNFEGNVAEREINNIENTRFVEKQREEYLSQISPDLVLLTSLFEGFIDDAVTSIGLHSKPIYKTVTILYDLIPYLTPDPNWPDHYKNYFYRKIDSFKNADLYLSISEYSKQEAVSVFPNLKSKIFNISSACNHKFQPNTYDEVTIRHIFAKFGIRKKYIMSSGTLEPRKNFKELINSIVLLPKEIQNEIQLVIVGTGDKLYESEMIELAEKLGISSSLILTGHITDEELILLYNQSELFVFTSIHEGFGLPPLEAMSCGIPTIASNTTSLPEVINNTEALIDPTDPQNIADKITQVLTDQLFRKKLVTHSLKQSKNFSWDITAQKALSAIETLNKENSTSQPKDTKKPILAYVSPLPPEHTGIADYSAELLPELARYYNISVIVDQSTVVDDWILSNCTVHTPDWLRLHKDEIDRVIYHFGNSYFHSFMYSLLEDIPGIVVLHDFYLCNLFIALETNINIPNAWAKELYKTHGYRALYNRYIDPENTKLVYPVSQTILKNAMGVIVHSEYSKKLANQWYGRNFSKTWSVIPLLRKSTDHIDKNEARKILGLNENDFIVGSFGIIDYSKLNHVTLAAWINSSLSTQDNSLLVFIGEGYEGPYYEEMMHKAKKYNMGNKIRFTGRCEADIYRLYLASVDIAVQLRTNSRGETSAAVLDTMNNGIATIVNANGSMMELDEEAVIMLPDKFEEAHLSESLEKLYTNSSFRHKLGDKARDVIKFKHAPYMCAGQYYKAIEDFYLDEKEKCVYYQEKRLFLDITATAQNGLRTGIERVTRAITKEFIDMFQMNYRIEPVYLASDNGQWHYKYARTYTQELLNCPPSGIKDEIVELSADDVVLGLDISEALITADLDGFYTQLRQKGVKTYHMLYDMLPVTMPQFFPEGTKDSHSKWLEVLAKFDGIIAISKTISDEFKIWLNEMRIQKNENINIMWNHLGADIDGAVPSLGLPSTSSLVLDTIKQRPTFLIVSTIEPRKGHMQTIDAFTTLWKNHTDVNLVIIGWEGWKHLDDDNRRTIPEIVQKIKNHNELNKRLFWLEGISDEYLEKVYALSTCLLLPSEGEGFGLPLIEAAQHKKPIIARDLPVFREIAGKHAYYFVNENDPDVITEAINNWLSMYNKNLYPKSEDIVWLTWKKSAEKLFELLMSAELPKEDYFQVPYTFSKSAEKLFQAVTPKEHLNIDYLKDQYNFKLDDFCKYDDEEFIENAYRGIFKREADSEGKLLWLSELQSGSKTKNEILDALISSDEAKKHGVVIQGLDNLYQNHNFKLDDFCKYDDEEFIENAYKGILKRKADSEGKLFWLSKLQAGVKTKEQILREFCFSQEGKNKEVTISEFEKGTMTK